MECSNQLRFGIPKPVNIGYSIQFKKVVITLKVINIRRKLYSRVQLVREEKYIRMQGVDLVE